MPKMSITPRSINDLRIKSTTRFLCNFEEAISPWKLMAELTTLVALIMDACIRLSK